MKKVWKAALILGMAVCMLSGCGGQTVKEIDTGELADNLYSGVTWQDQLGEVDLSKALTLYGIPGETVASGKVYMGTNATAEEVAVLEAASAEQVTTIEEGIQGRVDAQLTSFQSYNAEEVPKLEHPLIVTKGNYIIFCVCDDTVEAEAIIEDCFAE